MKPIRMISLGLIGLFVARGLKPSNRRDLKSLGGQLERLLPARTSAPRSPRQGRIANAESNLPDYSPESPDTRRRQPANTPPDQVL